MLKIKAPQLRVLDGRYSLLRAIGQGSAGVVYEGTQLAVDRTVAVKLLHSGREEDKLSLARFNLEAKALGQLNHPGCVTLFDFGYDTKLDAYFMVMEFIHGASLCKVRELGISLRDELGVMASVCRAVGHAHKKGITHRDLKPSNIMLPHGSTAAKVLDFGLAKLYAQTLQNERISITGEIYGTPAYMSPEQARGEEHVGPAADVYALGIMLYEAIEKVHPFPGKTPAVMLMMHIETPIPQPRSPHVSSALHDLLVAMTQKDPATRPHDLEQIALLLEKEMALLLAGHSPALTMRTLPQFRADQTQETWDGFREPGSTLDHDDQPAGDLLELSVVDAHHAQDFSITKGKGRLVALVILVIGALMGGSFFWSDDPELDASTYATLTLAPAAVAKQEAYQVPVTYLPQAPFTPRYLEPKRAQAQEQARRKPPRLKPALAPRAKTLSL